MTIIDIVGITLFLSGNEPVTVFAENFALLPYNSNTGTPTYVLFNADCPLEIIKHDGLPFHRIYRTEDGQSYGASDLRILLENYVFNELPAELKQGIKTVVNRQSAWDIETAALVPETTHDRLWIPSENEYFNSRRLSPDSTELLGNGVIHGINGFGVDRMIGRSVLG